MAFFTRIKKQKPQMDDCQHLSALGADPGAWDGLDDDELKQVVSVKFIEYGATQDGSRIAGLFALYRYAIQRLDVDERRAMLTEFSEMIEQHGGLGHMGLMMFLAEDTDPGIRSSAALSLSVLFDPAAGDELAGPRFVTTRWSTTMAAPRDKARPWAASCCWATSGSCRCWRRSGTNFPRRRSWK
jgi:hypothetical protein